MLEWKNIDEPPEPFTPVLISFENCNMPAVGYYIEEKDGNEFVSALGAKFDAAGLVVNGWLELPKCKGR